MDKFFLGLGIGMIIGAVMVVFSDPPREKDPWYQDPDADTSYLNYFKRRI